MTGAEVCERCGAEVAGDDAGYLMAEVICPQCFAATFHDAGCTISVCEDCLLAANGWEEICRDAGHESRYMAAMALHGAQPEAFINAAGEVRQSFGKYPCGFCGGTLWGSRYEAQLHEVTR